MAIRTTSLTLLGCEAVGSNNRAQWCNKEFNDLVKKAKVTTDQAERTKLYEEAQVVFKRKHLGPRSRPLPVHHVPMRKEVTGFRPAG